jgi:hypothetical protein
LYFDAIMISLLESAPEALEVSMDSLGFDYQSDFARRYVAQGKAEGRMELTLELLARRFGLLPDMVRTRVRGAQAAQLDAIAEWMFTAQTLEQALGSLHLQRATISTDLSIARELIERALQVSGEAARKAAVTKVLEELITRRRQKQLLGRFGKLQWDNNYDYKRERWHE